MIGLFVLLLLIFLGLFYGPGLYSSATGADIQVAGVSLQSAQIQVVLASGIAFLQFAIVIFSVLDRIAETFKLIIKPIAVLLPLVAFLAAMYRTFAPIFASFLPQGAAQAMGVSSADIATWVTSAQFATGILITFGTMLLFLLAYRALTTESDEVRALKAELARTRRALR